MVLFIRASISKLTVGESNWKWPEVEGLNDFQGPLIHTAAWPKEFDYTGKTVAVIGNGASGVQLLPAIQPGEWCTIMHRYLLQLDLTKEIDVAKIYHIIRTPTWIPPPWRQSTVQFGGGQMLKEISVDKNENFPQEQIQRFKDDDEFYRRFVKGIEKDTSGNFRMVRLPRCPPAHCGYGFG